MKNIKDKKTLYKILRLYYRDNLTQSKIAKRLNLTRIKVARYLYYARDNNMIEVKLDIPEGDYSELENKIENTYKLKECRIAPTFGKEVETYKYMGRELSDILEKILESGNYLGISWSKTLLNVSEYIDMKKRSGANIVPIVGGVEVEGNETNINFIVRSFSERLGGKGYYINAPAVVDNKNAKKIMEEDSNTKRIIDLTKNISSVVTGIGNINSEASLFKSGYFKKEEIDFLDSLGVIGSINLDLINKDGKQVKSKIDDRIIKIFPLERLKKVENIIGIALGKDKVDSIKASLGNIINIFITDESTAKRLVK